MSETNLEISSNMGTESAGTQSQEERSTTFLPAEKGNKSSSYRFPLSGENSFDFASSLPVHKSLRSMAQDDGGCIAEDWQMELSPIAKSRGSDICGEFMRVPNLGSIDEPCNGVEFAKDPEDYDKENSPLQGVAAQDQMFDEKHDSFESNPTSSSTEFERAHSDWTRAKPKDSGRKALERSIDGSYPTQLDRDLSFAIKQIDVSSQEFIQRIRNAAHRRKKEMTRSRDSLAAKEQEQRLTIAASKQKSLETVTTEESEAFGPLRSQPISDLNFKPFKARPLPKTTGEKGGGGLSGVPRVDSKPTTTPSSPRLGSRRRDKVKAKSLEEHKNSSSTIFKARPLPATTNEKGEGGLSGIPKVESKPATIPLSPLLASRKKSVREFLLDS